METSDRKGDNVAKVEAALREHLCRMRAEIGSTCDFPISKVTLTYGGLVALSGVGVPQGQKAYLDAIADGCRSKGEPPLDCLVVNKKTGRPGKEFGASWESQVRAFF